MKRILLAVSLFVLLLIPYIGKAGDEFCFDAPAKGGAAACTPTISEPFTYSSNGYLDTMSSNVWTALNWYTHWTVTSSQVVCSAGGWETLSAMHSTAVGSPNQYAKIKVVMLDGNTSVGVALRFTDASTHFYSVIMNPTTLTWLHCVGSTCTSIATGSLAIANGDTVGISLTGAGASTYLRAFNNPVANCSTSATSWDATNDYDLQLITTSGTNNVDTGNYVGLSYNQGTANVGIVDNFYAGPLP